MRGLTFFGLVVVVLAVSSVLHAAPVEYHRPVNAAPKPEDIGGAYVIPAVQRSVSRSVWWGAVDVAVLSVALAASAWLALRRRSRRGLVFLTIGSLAYFGFYRDGCVCPIGAIQNVAVALVDHSYAVPLVVVIFFFLPLVAALLFGRVFCGGVCPLGAIADLVVIRPVEVPRRLDGVLGAIKYLYLIVAVWLAIRPAESRDFVICRFDPFVGFFRLAGPGHMLIIGGILLLVGMFIARPYCRYLCPYGAILAVLSRFSWRGVTITPDKELDCGLCVGSCPFGAIEKMRAVRSSCLSCGRCYRACPVGNPRSPDEASVEGAAKLALPVAMTEEGGAAI
ncbi:MAG TPA: 4Fe-4S binding protein [Phycisphaerae bacterium]|nr:4Fe-4S binding protein [Phycisphaerae bacterium]HRY70598.1 4Fe-4S binding protein [Phycisphaerae bacterium]HSA28352.1 4Fe-4S binding protein [Phycisphaerae bacterium]